MLVVPFMTSVGLVQKVLYSDDMPRSLQGISSAYIKRIIQLETLTRHHITYLNKKFGCFA